MAERRTYRRRYRRKSGFWRGEIFLFRGEWIDHFMEEAPPPSLVWAGWALTEARIRRRLARRLWRLSRPKRWLIRGLRDG